MTYTPDTPLTYAAELRTIREWAEVLGLTVKKLIRRLKRLPVQEAIGCAGVRKEKRA